MRASPALQHWHKAYTRHTTPHLLRCKPADVGYLSKGPLLLKSVRKTRMAAVREDNSTHIAAQPTDTPQAAPNSSSSADTQRLRANSTAGSSAMPKATFVAAMSAAAFCCYTFLSGHQEELPKLPPWTGAALPAVGLAVLLGRQVSGFRSLGDTVHLELHRGRLYLQTGVPSQGPQIPPGAVVVRATGDGRGNGAYAATLIPRGSRICEYEGELLTAAEYLQRYPDGVSDYAMSIDNEYVSDAVGLVADTSKFHAVHMNHSSKRANVVRFYERAMKRVTFFASRDIHPGEELLFDYGRNYWRGREHLELP